ncbi:hypothetical protein [Tritonibacter mobilis]|uniref:hypothetical protein n=1 Tax=Tritonibacter mobilis TaxID=379347 RepID=UPI003A5BB39F
MSGFADAIGLDVSWPVEFNQSDEMSVTGLVRWARAYLNAAEILHFSERHHGPEFYPGPVIQNVGLATELTLKTMLRGGGKSPKDMRTYSHNTYKAYCDARSYFDEVKFINLHFSNTSHISVPEEVRIRLSLRSETDIEHRWRVYFDHLRVLDSVYDRPYRTRYVTPGSMVLPETEVILVGTKLLLTAMEERLAD